MRTQPRIATTAVEHAVGCTDNIRACPSRCRSPPAFTTSSLASGKRQLGHISRLVVQQHVHSWGNGGFIASCEEEVAGAAGLTMITPHLLSLSLLRQQSVSLCVCQWCRGRARQETKKKMQKSPLCPATTEAFVARRGGEGGGDTT